MKMFEKLTPDQLAGIICSCMVLATIICFIIASINQFWGMWISALCLFCMMHTLYIAVNELRKK
jgi:hypothetical protein